MVNEPTRKFGAPDSVEILNNLNCNPDDGPVFRKEPNETRGSDETRSRYIDLLRNLNPAIRKFPDPKYKIPSYAIQKQKVLTLKKSQLDALEGGKWTVYAISNNRSWLGRLLFGKRRRLLRSLSSREASQWLTVSDCPNPLDRYSEEPTYTVLLEWTENTTSLFPDIELRDENGQIVDLVSEPNNNFLVISVTDPNNKPGPPVASNFSPSNSQPTDFKVLTSDDIDFYEKLAERAKLEGPTVAVLDTGIKFNLNNAGISDLANPHEYRDASNNIKEFVLAYKKELNPGCDAMEENRLGYCSINAYKQEVFAERLGCEISDIRNSPFDDNRFFGDPDSTTYLDGRHGTSIAAIIQQRANAPILPVKAFDNLGFSTLFDILNALNYILQHREPGKIYIINASWIFGRNELLLEQKIEQLMHAGIFIIAAAGNRNQTIDRNLEHVPVYPACYSEKYPNVITVTSVTKELSDRSQAHLDENNLIVTTPVLDGFVAVENFSRKYVNVGVLSTLGFFPSPFWESPSICGSSFACAYVSAAVARELHNPPSWLLAGTGIPAVQMRKKREEILKAICKVDTQLEKHAVLDGYYLEI